MPVNSKTKPKETTPAKLENPLDGATGVAVFTLVVLLGAGVVFITCSETALTFFFDWMKWAILPLSFTEAEKLILPLIQIFCLLIILGWVAFTGSRDGGDFFIGIVVFGLMLIAFVTAVIYPNHISFWASLLILVLMSFIAVEDKTDFSDDWTKFTAYIYTAWIVSSLFITLGRTSYLPYAEPLVSISQIHFLLDIRILATALILIIFIGKAVIDAADKGIPEIPALPNLKIPELESFAANNLGAAIVNPFINVINAILLVLQKITNLIWYMVATVGVYLYRVGSGLAEYFVKLILESEIWLAIGKTLLTFTFAVIVILGTGYLSPLIKFYLTSDTSFFSISADIFWIIMLLAGGFAGSLCLIVLTGTIWEFKGNLLGKAAFAGSMLLIAWALSAALAYGFNASAFMTLRGFNSMGIYSLFIIVIIGLVFLFQVARSVIKK